MAYGRPVRTGDAAEDLEALHTKAERRLRRECGEVNELGAELLGRSGI